VAAVALSTIRRAGPRGLTPYGFGTFPGAIRKHSIAIVSAAPRRYAAWSGSVGTVASTVHGRSAALVRSARLICSPTRDTVSPVFVRLGLSTRLGFGFACVGTQMRTHLQPGVLDVVASGRAVVDRVS
jgi:hypothetical protein